MFINLRKIRLKILIAILISIIICIFSLEFFLYQQNREQLPILIWWTPFIYENKKIINCHEFKCIVTKDRNYLNKVGKKVLLFYASNLEVDDLPLPKNDLPWAIFHEESPKNLAFFNYLKGQELFDITSTFSRFSDMPLTFQYLREVNLLTDLTYYKPVEYKNKLLKNLAPILYIQSDCETPIQRDKQVTELMKYIKVDSYGTCLNNKKIPKKFKLNGTYDVYEEHFMDFVSQYKFVIAIENAKCEDYITEKLWRPLIVGSVPIYLGSPSVTDWLPNKKSAILIRHFKNMKNLAEYVENLNNDDRLYLEYLQHKETRTIRNQKLIKTLSKGYYGIDGYSYDIVQSFECYICKNYKIATSETKENVFNCPEPSRETFWDTHWKLGKCQAKVLHNFIRDSKLHNFTKDMYNNLTNKYFLENNCE